MTFSIFELFFNTHSNVKRIMSNKLFSSTIVGEVYRFMINLINLRINI
jgi:hypothetical protein